MTTTKTATARYCSKPGCTNRLIHPDSLEAGKCLSCQGVLNSFYHGERGGAERTEPPFYDEMKQAAEERSREWISHPQD